MTETQTEVNLGEMSKEELLEHAHSLGIHPANAGMTKDELREAIEQASQATGQASEGTEQASDGDEVPLIEEYGAEAIMQGIEPPPTPVQEAVEVNEEYGAEARYWAGEYTDGEIPTEPPGGWPGEEVTPATVTDVAPATIALGPPADEILTVTGTGFTEASVLTINDVAQGASYVSDTSLETTVVAGTYPEAAVLSVAVDGSAPFAVTVA